MAARAKALLWPAVDRTRGAGEALLPGITSPSGPHVFVSAEHFDQEVAFFRTLFDLTPGSVEEFVEPHGRLRSRALRPAAGDRTRLSAPRRGPRARGG